MFWSVASVVCAMEIKINWISKCRRWCLCWLNSIKNIKTIHTFNRFRDVIKMQLAIGNRPLAIAYGYFHHCWKRSEKITYKKTHTHNLFINKWCRCSLLSRWSKLVSIRRAKNYINIQSILISRFYQSEFTCSKSVWVYVHVCGWLIFIALAQLLFECKMKPWLENENAWIVEKPAD